MRNFRFILPILATLLSTAALAEPNKDVEGTWVADGGYASFELFLCGDGTQLCATLLALGENTEAPVLEPLVGNQILFDLPATGENQWGVGGSLENKNGAGTITLVSPTRIDATGCLADDCGSLSFSKVS